MPNGIKILRQSTSGNYIVSVVIGRDYLQKWTSICKKNWLKYCDKHDLGLAILNKPTNIKNRNPHWQKYFIGNDLAQLTKIDNICYMDYDVLINPNAENIFTTFNKDKIGLVSQERNLPYSDSGQIRKTISFYRNYYLDPKYPLNSALLFNTAQRYESFGLKDQNDYACMGVFIYNYSKFQGFLSQIAENHSGTENVLDSGDELIMNHHILSKNLHSWLDYSWQALWLYEVATNYSHLYEDRFQCISDNYKAISSCLKRVNFLHFAGSWEKAAFDTLEEFWESNQYGDMSHLENFLSQNIVPKEYGRITLETTAE
jgi:hypothetical protein